MSVRTAELLMAMMMGVFSIYLMFKSYELPVGWIEGEGPGGGAWPFWLSLVMLLSCLGIIFNWIRKVGPIATSDKVFVRADVLTEVGAVAISLIVTVALFSIIGIYGALPLFLIFYVRFLGGHSWMLTSALAIIIPVSIFFFFEVTLKIILPKGYTEPLFIPLYKMFF